MPATLELRAVVALDDDQIELRLAVTELFCRLIVRRAETGERRVVARKLQHHAASARPALGNFATSATHQEAAAETADRRRRRRHIGLVAFRIGYIHLHDPVALARRRRGWRSRLRPVRVIGTFDDDEIALRVR